MTRREFTHASAALATSALSSKRLAGANERVHIGLIGVGSRGDELHRAFLEHGDMQVTAVCDIRDDYMDYAVERARGTPSKFKDYRKLLEQKDVDAVVIATPDHWHALMTIHACQAGKDVYVEKPLSLTVVEGRRMVQAVRHYKRVSQVGTHRRSARYCQQATELVRSGHLGHISVADSYYDQNEWPKGIGNPADSKPPSQADFELWLGPAPKVAYNPNRTYYKFRWFWDHSGGQVTNTGVHWIDLIQWGLGQDAPKAVVGLGGHYVIDDNREVPDTAKLIWEYPGGTLVGFSQVNGNSARERLHFGQWIEFRGTKGTLYLRNGGYVVVPETIHPHGRFRRTPLDRETERQWRKDRQQMIEPQLIENMSGSPEAHARNFLDCVKSRERCTADVEIGHRSTTTTLIGNIAMRLRKYLEWDSQAERFTNNEKANEYLHYEYRAPWELPKIG